VFLLVQGHLDDKPTITKERLGTTKEFFAVKYRMVAAVTASLAINWTDPIIE
jgi:hypothetical protein